MLCLCSHAYERHEGGAGTSAAACIAEDCECAAFRGATRIQSTGLEAGQRITVESCDCYDADRHAGRVGTVQDVGSFITHKGGIDSTAFYARTRLDGWYRVVCLVTVASETEVQPPKKSKRNREPTAKERRSVMS